MQLNQPDTGKIVALSVAMPRPINMNGREVTSAIVRSPSTGPLEIVEGGIAGNQPAVHTEHVLAFPAEHYDYWSERLGTPRGDWDWCWWGENLTVRGMSEEELHIGDTLEIGNAQFRVTSPRIPCFKVAWRVGQPDSVLPKMMETGRVGFHLEVVRPGTVSLTDAVRVTATEPDAITVAELSRVLLSQSPDILPLLKQTLALPALGFKARKAVQQRIHLIEDKQRLQIGRWRGWRAFTIDAIKDEADGIRSFHLRPEDGEPIAPPVAGQFLTVRPDLPGEVLLTRPWTISGVDLERNQYRITVRRIEGGRGTKIMHERIGPNSRVHLRTPAGLFTLDRSGFRRIALVSGGIGVTPMLAMLKDYVAMGSHAPPLLWLQVIQNAHVHAFRDEVATLLSAAPRAHRIVWYTNPEPQDVLGRDYDRAGRPTAEEIQAIIKPKYPVSPFGKEFPVPGTETEFYLCGPSGLESMLRTTLNGLGVRPELIKSEAFASVGAASPASIETTTVHFTSSGITAQWHADDGLTLLDLAEAAGLEPPYACRSGSCQSCSSRISDGQVDYTARPAIQPEPGSVLLCCTRPASTSLSIAI